MSGLDEKAATIRTALDAERFMNELRSTQDGRAFLDGEADSVRLTRSFLDREADIAQHALDALDEIVLSFSERQR